MIKARVRWDEANLNEIEANKPVREKVLEPKTPYHPIMEDDGFSSPALDSSDCSAAHAEALRSALNKVAISEKHSRPLVGSSSSSSSSSSEDGTDEGDARERRAINFEDHRRAHYDEFKKVKELQEKANNCLLDYEDDYSDNEARCNSSPSLSIGIRDVDIHSDDEILKTICIQGN